MTTALRASREGLLVAALVAAVTTLSIAACNGSHANPPAPTEAGAVCPATPDETIGAACSVERLQCGPQYTCGVLDVSLLCVCHEGSFRCTDLAGNELTAAPSCPGVQRTSSCPGSESSAILAGCTEQGLLCTYPSHCPARFDQCECFPGPLADGGFGLHFDCQLTVCGGDGGTVVFDSGSFGDSGHDAAPDVGRDAGSDASGGGDSPAAADADANSPSDGPGPTDAPPADAPPG